MLLLLLSSCGAVVTTVLYRWRKIIVLCIPWGKRSHIPLVTHRTLAKLHHHHAWTAAAGPCAESASMPRGSWARRWQPSCSGAPGGVKTPSAPPSCAWRTAGASLDGPPLVTTPAPLILPLFRPADGYDHFFTDCAASVYVRNPIPAICVGVVCRSASFCCTEHVWLRPHSLLWCVLQDRGSDQAAGGHARLLYGHPSAQHCRWRRRRSRGRTLVCCC